jgi:hypothetical protein
MHYVEEGGRTMVKYDASKYEDNSMEKNPEIGKLQEDIKGMRRLMDLGASSFKQIYAARHFKFFFLASFIITGIIPILYATLTNIVSDSQNLTWIIIATGGAGWLFLFSYKAYITNKEAKKLGLTLNWLGLIKEQMSSRIWLSVIPTLLVLILLPLKFPTGWSAADICAYTGIILGLVLNLIGVLIAEREYLFCGFWMIAAGLICYLIIQLPAYVEFPLVFSPGCLLFFIVASISARE